MEQFATTIVNILMITGICWLAYRQSAQKSLKQILNEAIDTLEVAQKFLFQLGGIILLIILLYQIIVAHF